MQFGLIARAKVNLCLHVGHVREDGLHDLASVAVFPHIGDHISVQSSDHLALTTTGPFASDLADLDSQDNLILKFAMRLRDYVGHSGNGAHFSLKKNIPVASGIGGGTADATAALILLRKLWALNISDDDLMRLSFELAADGPICLAPYLYDTNCTAMYGAGEKIVPFAPISDTYICLVNPLQPVPTGSVFQAFDHKQTSPQQALIPEFTQMKTFFDLTRNDLQSHAIEFCPAIAQVLEHLDHSHGCFAGRMSGSGATCFGLFDNHEDAEKTMLEAQKIGWWASISPL